METASAVNTTTNETIPLVAFSTNGGFNYYVDELGSAPLFNCCDSANGSENGEDFLFWNGSSSGAKDSGPIWYKSSLGVLLAVPEWEAAATAVTLSIIIVLTLVGNAMVIMSVFTYRPLRSPPNFFIVSLAVADMTVALLVLPLNVAYSILGRWVLGKIVCEFWLTSDVLCCTGKIWIYIS